MTIFWSETHDAHQARSWIYLSQMKKEPSTGSILAVRPPSSFEPLGRPRRRRLRPSTTTLFMLDGRFGFGPHETRRCIGSRPCISSFCVPTTVTEAVCGWLLALSNPWTLLLNLFTRESSSHCIARSESQQKHYYNAKHWSTLHVCDIYVGVFDAFIRLSCWVFIGQWTCERMTT